MPNAIPPNPKSIIILQLCVMLTVTPVNYSTLTLHHYISATTAVSPYFSRISDYPPFDDRQFVKTPINLSTFVPTIPQTYFRTQSLSNANSMQMKHYPYISSNYAGI